MKDKRKAKEIRIMKGKREKELEKLMEWREWI